MALRANATRRDEDENFPTLLLLAWGLAKSMVNE